MNPGLTKQQIQDTLNALVNAKGNKTHAAAALGIPRPTLQGRIKSIQAQGITVSDEITVEQDFTVDALPDPETPLEELLQQKRDRFLRRNAFEEAVKLMKVNVMVDGPVGILHFGDPHVDDDGCDIFALERDIKIIRNTKGMFGGNVGDNTNNWVGRLGRLYGKQAATEAESWRLAEWFLNQVNWMYLVGGNHDMWSGSDDPIPWIIKNAEGNYMAHENRFKLAFPNGQEVRIYARHTFKGHSMWNPSHAQMRASQMGYRDHILISGHKHMSGYGMVKDPSSGLISHCIQVGSYKKLDDYPKELGLADGNISPSVVTIIDPYATDAIGIVHVFHDTETGADFLKYLRKKRGFPIR